MDNCATSTLLFELMGDDNGVDRPDMSTPPGLSTSQDIYRPAFAAGSSFPARTEGAQSELLPFYDSAIHNLEDLFLDPSSDLFQGFILPIDGEEINSSHWPSDAAASQNDLEELISESRAAPRHVVSAGAACGPEHIAAKRASAPVPPARRPRRQNHACDQCRSAKRACNFRNDIAIYRQRPLNPCTTCVSRSLDCTVEWLVTKKASSQLAKRRPMNSTADDKTAETFCGSYEASKVLSQDHSSSIPTSDVQLVRYYSVRETCIHHFSLYVDIVDMPLSQFLLRGTMPQRYSLGVEALSPLSKKDSFLCFSNRADQWVNNCWDPVPEARLSLTVAPHIFHTVSVLDSIFERRESPNDSHPLNARDDSINKAYKWAALASAARFSSNPDGDKAYYREFGHATWQKAKQTIFENLAAIGSFRLALALVIFGTVESPGPIEQRTEAQEISTYALCEGVKRLQTLCRQARLCLKGHRTVADHRCFWSRTGLKVQPHPAHELPREVQENLVELIAAVEWLFGFIHAARTVLSYGKIQPLSNDWESATTGDWPRRYDTTRLLTIDLPETHDYDDGDQSPALRISEDGLTPGLVTLLWRSDASESTIMQKLKGCGILSILLWDVLARLTIACDSMSSNWRDLDEIRQLCISANDMIKLYRAKFETFDAASASSFQEAPPEIRQMAAMISNDSDLGVLLYFNIRKTFQDKLSEQPTSTKTTALMQMLDSTREFCVAHRLISAIQISAFACAQQGASPGLQGAEGLKAQIQDLAAHPCPAMVVQANHLAAITLSEELNRLVARAEAREASKVAANIDGCLKALQALESSLVTSPSLTREVD